MEAEEVTWYFYDSKDTEMHCGLCVRDNQVWMYAGTGWVARRPQAASCFHCGWCPKTEGLVRPDHRKKKQQIQDERESTDRRLRRRPAQVEGADKTA